MEKIKRTLTLLIDPSDTFQLWARGRFFFSAIRLIIIIDTTWYLFNCLFTILKSLISIMITSFSSIFLLWIYHHSTCSFTYYVLSGYVLVKIIVCIQLNSLNEKWEVLTSLCFLDKQKGDAISEMLFSSVCNIQIIL